MKNNNAIPHVLTSIHLTLGKCLCWLAGLMALVIFTIVVLRTFFQTGTVAGQESVTYMHATLFLLCLSFAAHEGAHVRVDIFYKRWGEQGQHWVDLIGTVVFMLPFACFLTFTSWPFALTAWQIGESSINPGGIPAVFLLKSLIPLSGFLLIVYGITKALEHLRNISFVTK